MSENDARRLAEQLMTQHGDKATVVAANKFVQFHKGGNAEGAADWVKIMLAIRDLKTDKPSASEIMN